MLSDLWGWIQQSPFATATVNDWIDIGVLTLLIYGFLMMLRGTRAFQSLLGLGLLGALYLLSGGLGMSAVHWVLDNVMVYAVIALLILFQEDIRRILAKAGGTVYQRSTAGMMSEAQQREEMIKAVFTLASRRIGALVVLERNASLAPYAEGAHPVDSVVTTELLTALFHPSSPVHDGAILISHGRIAYAGVFLPISLSKGLPKAYGTRHRAAIGLTERADAIALLVSEERGTVSVVHAGQVVPVADSNDLRQRLEEVVGQESAPSKAQEVAPG